MSEEERIKANKPLADKLKQLRKNKGLTSKQVCQDLNNAISGANLRAIENGHNSVNNKNLVLLATYYGVTTDWLLSVPGADKDKETVDYRGLVKDVKGLKEELNYWRTMARSYERTILKLSAIIAEGKHEDN